MVTIGQKNGEGRELPAALIRLRDKSAVRFKELLDAFFDGADDALFNLSERAYSNADQNTYFDAMRELRIQRKTMTLSFQQWLARAFNDGGRFEPIGSVAGEGHGDRDSLSLVDDETLEEQVAIDNMVMRLRNHYSEPVELIRLRIAELLRNPDLESAQNPLGPEVICQGLAECCSGLSIDIRSRLVIYKLFDKRLITQLGQLYNEANQLLIDEGVLPKIRNRTSARGGKTQDKGTAPTGSAKEATGSPINADSGGRFHCESGPDSDGTDMQTLLQLLRSNSAGMPLAAAGSSSGSSGGGGGMTPAQTSELVQMLSGVQTQNLSGAGELVPIVVRAVEQQQRDVRQGDSDVINLVSMLFDFILEDRHLPEAMKALVSRLQIPMVKVGLMDPGFFERGGHPARRLLNELAGAAMIWNGDASGRSDSLYEHMEAAISRIQNEFTDDVSVFESVLDEFTAFMEKDKRRRDLVEQRLRDAEEGRARDQQAKEAAQVVLDRAVGDRDLPEGIRKLLDNGWFRVLKWHHLREGEQGQGWQHHRDLTERLIWTLDPQPRVRATRPALLREIPRVVTGMREGLRLIAWDPFRIDECLHELELAHVDVLQKLKTAPDETGDHGSAPWSDEGATGGSGSELFNITDVSPPGVAAGPAAVGVEVRAEANESEPVESDSTTARQPDAEHAGDEQPGAIAESDQSGETGALLDLDVGAWLEWQSAQGEPVRCKLAAVIRATGKYIFVNRNGARVVEYMRGEVARALHDGTLQRLDDGMIFDRALESVIDSLRGSKAG